MKTLIGLVTFACLLATTWGQSVDVCAPNPCLNGGLCWSSTSDYSCICTSRYSGTHCEIHLVPGSECPSDAPYQECSWGAVCGSNNCYGQVDVRCVINHCGGCRALYYDAVGARIDCETRAILECQEGISATVCLADPCQTATCPAKTSARCVSNYCGGCKAEFFDEQGKHVNCFTGETRDCPAGLEWFINFVHFPCGGETCPNHPTAECHEIACKPHVGKPVRDFFDARGQFVECGTDKDGSCPSLSLGTCSQECEVDSDCLGAKKCCSNGCGHTCVNPTTVDVCSSSPCLNGAICSSTTDGYTCICALGYSGTHCEISYVPGVCTRDAPYQECSYDAVCGQTSNNCYGQVDVRCVINHCGGCRALYYDAVGARIDCETRAILGCQEGISAAVCFADPCLTATCPAKTSARCISNYCGGCKAEFFDERGKRVVNCTTGETSDCPAGLAQIIYDAPLQYQPCGGQTCPNHPTAECQESACQPPNGNIVRDFFNARGQIVECGTVDVCSSNPCLNGGICSSTTNGYTCNCASGYSGTRCEIRWGPVDVCSSNPCLNGGICSNTTNGFSCNCASGFYGTRCGIVWGPVNVCSSNPCLYGGSCISTTNGFSCNCASGFSGTLCESFGQDPCQPNPCANGAMCFPGHATDTYWCLCRDRYYGALCEQSGVDVCSSNPCLNGGICSSTTNGYTCNCASGYSGTRCEIRLGPVDVCSSNPCLNGGICSNTTNGFSCNCASGFYGTRCGIVWGPVDVCSSNPCLNGGFCSSTTNGFSCNCASDFSGTRCERFGLDPCQPNPCANGATCFRGHSTDTYWCLCRDGYYGTLCEQSGGNDYCISAPCSNGGICASTATSYTCTCPSGLIGINCERLVPTSTANPPTDKPGSCPSTSGFGGICVQECQNDSGCTEAKKCCSNGCGHTCVDPIPVTSGPCASGPCVNGATCEDAVYGHICRCSPGFVGSRCEIVISQVPPTIACPPDSYHRVGSKHQDLVVHWSEPTVSHSSGVAMKTYQSRQSGSSFGMGSHTVYYRYVDASELEGTCSFTITVNVEKPDENGPGKPDRLRDNKGLMITITVAAVGLVVFVVVMAMLGVYMYRRKSAPKPDSKKHILKGQNSVEEQRYSNSGIVNIVA